MGIDIGKVIRRRGTSLERKDDLRRRALGSIATVTLGALEAKFLHPHSAAAWDLLALSILFGGLAAMLTPELLLALLAFAFEAHDDVNRPTDVKVRPRRLFSGRGHGSGSDIGDGRATNIEPLEERIRSAR